MTTTPNELPTEPQYHQHQKLVVDAHYNTTDLDPEQARPQVPIVSTSVWASYQRMLSRQHRHQVTWRARRQAGDDLRRLSFEGDAPGGAHDAIEDDLSTRSTTTSPVPPHHLRGSSKRRRPGFRTSDHVPADY